MKKNILLSLLTVALSANAFADNNGSECNDIFTGEKYTVTSPGKYCFMGEQVVNQTGEQLYLRFDKALGGFTADFRGEVSAIVTKDDNDVIYINGFVESQLSRIKRFNWAGHFGKACSGSACKSVHKMTTDHPKDTPAQKAVKEMEDYSKNYRKYDDPNTQGFRTLPDTNNCSRYGLCKK